MKLIALPYQADSSCIFAFLAHLKGAVFLDSGQGVTQGRYDILSAEPYLRLSHKDGVTYCERDGVHSKPTGKVLDILRQYLQPLVPKVADLPFCGGAIGYMSYDFATELALPAQQGQASLPSFDVGLYDWAVVVDHHKQTSYWVSQERDLHSMMQWEKWQGVFSGTAQVSRQQDDFYLQKSLEPRLSKQDYVQAYQKIQAYIQAGDCYQTNLTYCFDAPAGGNTWQAYAAIRCQNPAPFSAYLHLAQGAILSFSPERFLQLQGQQVTTCPIKGTRPHTGDPDTDAALIHDLQTNCKDRSENIMIVDLLRNDLGKVCAFGSVHVTELLQVKSFAGVHHLVSSIQGQLNTGEDALSLLEATFPGGSITGAPKYRAMQIIEELEQDARNIYCGTIGYVSFDGQMDSNIVIRTLVYSALKQTLELRVGGGIIADSSAASEYQETLDKVAVILKSLVPFVDQSS